MVLDVLLCVVFVLVVFVMGSFVCIRVSCCIVLLFCVRVFVGVAFGI